MAARRSNSCCSRSFFCACFASHSALRLASAASNSAFLRASSASSACGSCFGVSTGSNSSLKESTVSLSEDTSKASSSASRFIISISESIPIVLSFLKKAESYPMVTLCHNFARHQAAFSFASSCRKASCQSSMPLQAVFQTRLVLCSPATRAIC